MSDNANISKKILFSVKWLNFFMIKNSDHMNKNFFLYFNNTNYDIEIT